jgi:hypothetical protein
MTTKLSTQTETILNLLPPEGQAELKAYFTEAAMARIVQSHREDAFTDLRAQGASNAELLKSLSSQIGELLRREPGTVPVGDTAVEVPAAESVLAAEFGYRIYEADLEFLEVHAAISASVMNRRPIMQGVRLSYTNDNEPQLTINRGEPYGVDAHMRTVFLTFRMHDEIPGVEGEYWELDNSRTGGGGRSIPLTDDQVDRIVGNLVRKVREIVNSTRADNDN